MYIYDKQFYLIMKKLFLLFYLLIISSFAFAQINLSQGLISYIPFDSSFADVSGNGKDMRGFSCLSSVTFQSGFRYTTDRFGNPNSAADLNSGQQFRSGRNFLTYPHPLLFDTLDFTICYWIYRENLYYESNSFTMTGARQGAANDYRFYFDDRGCGAGSGPFLPLNRFIVSYQPGQNFLPQLTIDSLPFCDTLAWNFIAVKRYGDTISIFVDNQKFVSTGYQSHNLSVDSLCFGRQFTTSFCAQPNHFRLDDIMIYNRAVTDEEMDSIYNLNPGIATSLKEESSLGEIKIYPNPATEFLAIQSNERILNYEIYDLSGRLVRQNMINNNQIPIQDLAKGFYYLKLELEEGREYITKFNKF